MERRLSILFCVLLALPFVQMLMPIVRPRDLVGVEAMSDSVEFTLNSLFSGRYAADLETRFTKSIGFRSRMIKLRNQFMYSLFDDVHRDQGTEILLGEGNWLFQENYVEHYCAAPSISEERLRGFAGRMLKAQQLLAERGIAFFMVISPSKAEIYQEKLPLGRRRKTPAPGALSNRARLSAELALRGVNYLDAHQLFLERKTGAEPLFPPAGTHWNYYGCFLAYCSLVQGINERTELSLPLPQLSDVQHGKPRGTDKDLESLLNLMWFSAEGDQHIPYPVVASEAREPSLRPNVLLVGDSFGFTLIDSMRSSKMANRIEFLYYNRRTYSYPPSDVAARVRNHQLHDSGPIDRPGYAWEPMLASTQLILLEVNEIKLLDESWGFLSDLVAFMDPDSQ